MWCLPPPSNQMVGLALSALMTRKPESLSPKEFLSSVQPRHRRAVQSAAKLLKGMPDDKVPDWECEFSLNRFFDRINEIHSHPHLLGYLGTALNFLQIPVHDRIMKLQAVRRSRDRAGCYHDFPDWQIIWDRALEKAADENLNKMSEIRVRDRLIFLMRAWSILRNKECAMVKRTFKEFDQGVTLVTVRKMRKNLSPFNLPNLPGAPDSLNPVAVFKHYTVITSDRDRTSGTAPLQDWPKTKSELAALQTGDELSSDKIQTLHFPLFLQTGNTLHLQSETVGKRTRHELEEKGWAWDTHRSHALKGSMCTWLFNRGLSLEKIMNFAGMSSTQTLATYYVRAGIPVEFTGSVGEINFTELCPLTMVKTGVIIDKEDDVLAPKADEGLPPPRKGRIGAHSNTLRP